MRPHNASNATRTFPILVITWLIVLVIASNATRTLPILVITGLIVLVILALGTIVLLVLGDNTGFTSALVVRINSGKGGITELDARGLAYHVEQAQDGNILVLQEHGMTINFVGQTAGGFWQVAIDDGRSKWLVTIPYYPELKFKDFRIDK